MKVSSNKVRLSLVALVLIVTQLPINVWAAETDPAVATATQNGLQYLSANQADSGAINGYGGETEWSAIAVEATGASASSFGSSTGNSLVDAIKNDVPADTDPTTAIERNTLAVAAVGGDTSNFNGTNYNSKLAAASNNGQIGDLTLLNDDIFGVIAIDATNDSSLKPVAQNGLDYFLAHQGADGGFSYTTATCTYCGSDSNDTAAAIIAMYAASDMSLTNPNMDVSRTNAVNYLLSTQQTDGGFASDIYSPSDGDSTSWGLMALNVLGQPYTTQATAARNWLLANQNPDGGFSYGAYGITASDTFTTAHAITALMGTSWLLKPAATTSSIAGPPVKEPATSPSESNVSAVSPPVNTVASRSQPTEGVVLASSSSDNAAPVSRATEPKASVKASVPVIAQASNKFKYAFVLYGLLLVMLVTLGWFTLRPKSNS